MLEYNLIFCLVLFGIILNYFNKKNNLYYYVICFLMLIICGLRKDVIGIDTINYLYFFTNPSDKAGYYQSVTTMEPGLGWINAFLRLFIDNKYIYQLLIAALCQIPIYLYIRKYSKNKYLSLFLYISFSIGTSAYFMSYNAMRQSIAIGVFVIFILLFYGYEGRFRRSILFMTIIMMVLIHKSSIIILLPFILSKLSISKKKYIMIVLVATLVGFIMNHFFSYLETIFIFITGGDFYTRNLGYGNFNVVSLLPYSLICLIMIFYCKKDELHDINFNFFVLAIIVQGVMAFSGNNVDRMCSYFYIPSYIAISNFLMCKFKPLYVRIPMLVCILVYFTYKYYVSLYLMTESGHNFIPYKWCL